MILGIIIGLAGLALVAIVYGNRDELAGRPQGRILAAYLLAVIASIALGVAVMILTSANQDICGPPGGSHSHCA